MFEFEEAVDDEFESCDEWQQPDTAEVGWTAPEPSIAGQSGTHLGQEKFGKGVNSTGQPEPHPHTARAKPVRETNPSNSHRGQSSMATPSAFRPVGSVASAAATKTKPGPRKKSEPDYSRIQLVVNEAIKAKDWTKACSHLRPLADRANQGDSAAFQVVVQTLDETPEIWQYLGDLAVMAESVLISAVSQDSTLFRESLRRKSAEMRAELLGENPNQLLKMTVGQVLLAWQFAQYVDIECASAARTGGISLALSKRQNLAEARYQKALKSYKLARELSRRSVPQMASQIMPMSGPAEDQEMAPAEV